MRKTLLGSFLLLFSLYSGICLYMFWNQDDFLFFPTQATEEVIQELDNLGYREVTFDRGERIISGWIPRDMSPENVILYFGGNAEDVVNYLVRSSYSGASLVAFNYPGYGKSTGTPSQDSLFSDAVFLYDFLSRESSLAGKNFYIMGRSLGTGVATYLASERMNSGVILITPYDSVENVASAVYPFLPVKYLLKHPFYSLEYARQKENRVLILYGGQDTVIPNIHTENLMKVWNGDVTSVFLSDRDHESIMDARELSSSIEAFIQ